jgi:hypothetical protein
MSDLYRMSVLAKTERAISLRVQCIYPDAYVADDEGFALMALRDGVPYEQSCPLSTEVSYEDLMDDVWASRYVRGFVKRVVRRSVEDPAAADRDPESWTLAIEVTDPAWIAHLHDGATWDSRAFSLARSYAEHPPISPTPDVPMEDTEGMFLWVPRECYVSNRRWTELPPLLEMPTYSENHYIAGAPIPLETLRPGSPWVGQPVHVVPEFGRDEVGALARVDAGGEPTIAGRSFGLRGNDIKRLCAVRPKVKRRPDEKLTYQTVLGRAETTISTVSCQGDRAVFTLRVPPDGRALCLRTETDALALLIEPSWVERDRLLPEEKSALLQALIADGLARDIESVRRLQDILPLVARNYIASFSVQPPPPPTGPALDSLSHAQARAALEAPWPTATVEVVVRDARWLEHLHGIDPRVSVRDRALPAPVEAAPEPPLPAPRPDERAILWRSRRQNTVWMIERFGQTLRQQSGRRDDLRREVSEASYASFEAAAEQAQREIAKKLKGGYERLPGGAEVQARVEAILGVTFDSLDPPRIATCADPAHDVDDTRRLRARDVIRGVGAMGDPNYTYIFTLEELAAALQREQRSAYVSFSRAASGMSGSVLVRL